MNHLATLLETRKEGWRLLERDQRLITFNEDQHKYTRRDIQNDLSVTGLLDRWFKFDAEAVSKKCVNSPKFKDCQIRSENGNIDVEASASNIRAKWQERASLGTALHCRIEKYLLETPDEKMASLLTPLDDYLCERGFALFRPEVRIFAPFAYNGQSLAGSIDALYCNEWGEAIIVDWKRSAPKFEFFSQRAEGIMANYPNTNYFKYAAQLNLYAHILKRVYNIPTVIKILVFFDDDLTQDAKIYCVPEMPEIELQVKLAPSKKRPAPLEDVAELDPTVGEEPILAKKLKCGGFRDLL